MQERYALFRFTVRLQTSTKGIIIIFRDVLTDSHLQEECISVFKFIFDLQ